MAAAVRDDLTPRVSANGLRGRDGKAYFASEDLVTAAQVALTLGRPLLLTGEPGCGKTDFAFAMAGALRAFGDPADPGLLECHVRSDARARDLLYHHDALARFGDAHHGGDAEKALARDARNYLQLLPLGRALVSPFRRVVLVDEVDKAPRDLPNDLLRELDHRSFEIPEIPMEAPEHPSGLRRVMGDGGSKPFVIITSNVERQLPDAFLRRCVFFRIPFPNEDALRTILKDRYPASMPLHKRVLDIFAALREVSLTKLPATSELVDWVGALDAVFVPAEVDRALTAFHAALSKASSPAGAPWAMLPALVCLVKLREDLEKLGAG